MPTGWFGGDLDTVEKTPVTGWWAEIAHLITPSGASLSVTGGVPQIRVSKVVVPGGASLTVTGGTPTVTATQNRLVEPTGASLSVIGSHPAIGVTVRPGGATPSITGGVPTILLSDNKNIQPSGASLSLTGGTPGVAATQNQFPTPTGAPLTITGGTPVVTASDHKVVTPSAASLAVTPGTPSVTLGIIVTPSGAALTITGGTPTVATPILITPSGASLSVVGSHPALDSTVRPTGGSLTVTGGVPTVALSDNKMVVPTGAPISVTGGTPSVTVTDNKLATPTGASLTVTGGTPTVTVSDNKLATPTAAPLTITGGTPTVTASDNKLIQPSGASLTVTGGTPTVTVSSSGPPWTDNFNRSNGSLGANWDGWDSSSAAAQISSNIMVPDPTTHAGEGRYLKTVTGSNIGASFVLKGTPNDAVNDLIYLGTGTNNPTDLGCGVVLLQVGTYTFLDSTGAPSASTGSITLADGDVLALEKYSGDSGSHSTLTLYRNGNYVASRRDTYTYSGSAEKAAIQIQRGASSTLTGIDDFTVYDAHLAPVLPTGAALTVTGGAPKVTAVSFIGGASAEATTVTVPAHAIGDIIVIYAFRDGATGAPTVPGTFTSMSTGNGTSCAHSVGYRVATATNDASGTWTSATGLICMVWRGANAPTNTTLNSGVSATPVYSSVTPTNAGSLVVGAAAHRSTNGDLNVAVGTLSTNRVNLAGATQDMAAFDTNGPVASYAGGTMSTAAETSSGWTTAVFALPPK